MLFHCNPTLYPTNCLRENNLFQFAEKNVRQGKYHIFRACKVDNFRFFFQNGLILTIFIFMEKLTRKMYYVNCHFSISFSAVSFCEKLTNHVPYMGTRQRIKEARFSNPAIPISTFEALTI